MLAFMAMVATAQEPQEFTPVPVDVVVDGRPLSGILVDEETYAELGRLRVESQVQTVKLQSFEEWKLDNDALFAATVDALRLEHEAGQDRLVTHYESRLKKAETKDLFQRHAFPFGVLVGFTGSAVVTIAVLNAYDVTLPQGITKN